MCKAAKQLFRLLFVTMGFIAVFFLTGQVMEVYAGYSLPGGKYLASDDKFEDGSNVTLDGDVTLILDRTLEMSSIRAGSHNLTIVGDGSKKNKLKMTGSGNVIKTGNLVLNGIELVIEQNKEI